MNIRIFTMAMLLIVIACGQNDHHKYLRWIGDIPGDPTIDDAEFKLCRGDKHVMQYFNMGEGLQYEGEKIQLVRQFEENFAPIDVPQSGWIRIRFIVNCAGKTGRFRLMESDQNYKEQTFDSRITDQLLTITKSLDGWEVLSENDQPVDYYQYLVFKIEDGQIKEILP